MLNGIEARRKTGTPPRRRLEYWAVRGMVGLLGRLPRAMARAVGAGIGLTAYLLASRLRRVGEQNLTFALPERSVAERQGFCGPASGAWDGS